ncbi:MAG: hypothetical protein ACKO1J_02920 [Tagaea sp.]
MASPESKKPLLGALFVGAVLCADGYYLDAALAKFITKTDGIQALGWIVGVAGLFYAIAQVLDAKTSAMQTRSAVTFLTAKYHWRDFDELAKLLVWAKSDLAAGAIESAREKLLHGAGRLAEIMQGSVGTILPYSIAAKEMAGQLNRAVEKLNARNAAPSRALDALALIKDTPGLVDNLKREAMGHTKLA